MARPMKDEASLSVPVTLRLTPRMVARMQRLSLADGITQQEHVRRAVDIYLNGMERALELPKLPLNTPPAEVAEGEGESTA